MAKSAYKIPYGLDTSYGDMEISIKSGDAAMSSKPLPIKILLAYLMSLVCCVWVMTQTIISSGSLPQLICFVICWVLLTLVLFKQDATGRMQAELILTLLNYIPKKARQVITRNSANALPFYQIAGIDRIDKKSGLVVYTDGTYGYWYRVVGSASVLLFDADKRAILDRVDGFYQKMNTECEVIFITTKAAQQVYKQVANLKRRYDRLEVRDPELLELADEQFRCLKNYVGKEFKSVHQYLVLKADNKEVLLQSKNILQSEVENSTRMIKRCIPMFYDDIVAVLEQIYCGKGR